MRIPPTVAASKRDCAPSSSSCMPRWSCSHLTRERIATPLYAACPNDSDRYPSRENSSAGNLSSMHFVSCMHRTSGLAVSSHFTACGKRASTELTFQVAIFIQRPRATRLLECGGNDAALQKTRCTRTLDEDRYLERQFGARALAASREMARNRQSRRPVHARDKMHRREVPGRRVFTARIPI